MKKTTAFFMCVTMIIAACKTVETPLPAQDTDDKQPQKVQTHAPIIGGVERVYVEDIKTPFHARIDTGAETSSIDVQNVKPFERDGEKWIAFDLVNRANGEKNRIEKPLKRKTTIKRTNETELRYVVKLKVRMGKNIINAEFTLNDRSRFDYQALIGRNIITGRYLVDTSLSNTLR